MDWINHYMDLFVGRLSDHSVQLETGLCARAGQPLDHERLLAHLRGDVRLATYMLDEQGQCRFVVFDGSKENDCFVLADLRIQLESVGIPAHLERCEWGGRLWVFLAWPMSPALLRTWLLPFCPPGIEFYPEQNLSKGYGSAIPLPFGTDHHSKERDPFVEASYSGQWRAIAPRISQQVELLYAYPRAVSPVVIATTGADPIL